MKIKPEIYAKTLLESARSGDLKNIVRNFWQILQKNKQYRDLSRILNSIDEENARKENKILTKVYSKNELSAQDEETLIKNLEKKFQKDIILKKIINKNITGIVVKVDDQTIDLSLEDKLNRLKKVFNNQ